VSQQRALRSLPKTPSWLLVFVPITVALEWLAPQRNALVFVVAAPGILPLAGWMGLGQRRAAWRSDVRS